MVTAPTICTWAMRLQNGKFVVVKPKGGKTPYWNGKLIGASVTAPTTTPTT